MLGLGLDKDDGPLRITRGDNYHLVGGSLPTHEKMQEVAVRVNESLSVSGKRLEEVSGGEFRDIVARAVEKVGD
ncbi:MAG: hypothetical protein JW909_13745 [Planctomycetes bacterium]|nr:hypothetical protein [Planctomycetota bacterium]